MPYQERTYHGIRRPEPVILVEEPASGWSERAHARVLYRLRPLGHVGFLWGYNGGGPAATAVAVLSDALGVDADAMDLDGSSSWGARLRMAFCDEVVTELCDEWRLNRRAVLRWTAGWYHQFEIPKPEILNDPSVQLGYLWDELTQTDGQ